MRQLLGRLIFAPATPFRVQNVVQRFMRGPRVKTVRFRDGHLFTCLTSEKYYWFRDSYEAEELRELESNLTPDSILFDVGAHAGFWEVALAQRCHKIHAFEPSPQNFNRLSRNVALNHLGNVICMPLAVSDHTGSLQFVEAGSMSHLGDTGIEVNAIKLDDYVAESAPPTVIKIDIEGHAGAALRGMQHTLSQYKPTLFLELHNTVEAAECHDALENLGYRFSLLETTTGFPYRTIVIPTHRH